jgi:hypothetical protein
MRRSRCEPFQRSREGQANLFREVGSYEQRPGDISEKGGNVCSCVEALEAALSAEVVEDSQTLDLIDLVLQEAEVREWNRSLGRRGKSTTGPRARAFSGGL